jgi:hypothetical protein
MVNHSQTLTRVTTSNLAALVAAAEAAAEAVVLQKHLAVAPAASALGL